MQHVEQESMSYTVRGITETAEFVILIYTVMIIIIMQTCIQPVT